MKLETTTTFKTGAKILAALNAGGKDAVEILGGNARFTLRAGKNKFKHGFAVTLRDDFKNQVYNIAGFSDARSQVTVADLVDIGEKYIQNRLLVPEPAKYDSANELPWSVHEQVSGYATIRDKNFMLVVGIEAKLSKAAAELITTSVNKNAALVAVADAAHAQAQRK